MRKDPWFRNRLIRDGIYQAIYERMREEDRIFILGEGSHMKVHFDAPKIEDEFRDRVITMPISEDANTNFAVGLSLAGIVPIVDVISSDFLYRTMDAICNTMAKAAAVGEARTMIVRAEFLTGGPTSGQRIEALFAHIPGLRVVVPSNPIDAYVLMHQALSHPGVTVFFEDRMIEDATTPEELKLKPTHHSHAKPTEGARVEHFGCLGERVDAVVASYGLTARRSRVALQDAGGKLALIDLRTLFPLDVEAVVRYTKTAKRLLVVEPDSVFMGIGAELVAQVAERLPGCKVKRLGGAHVTIPASRDRHDEVIPTVEKIQTALKELL